LTEIGERGEVERKEGDNWRSTETKTETSYTMTIGIAEEAIAPSAGNNRACSNGRYGEDKYSGC